MNHAKAALRSRRCLGFALCAALALAAPQSAIAAPSGADAEAYAHGQAYERLYQDHYTPQLCGIVLERPRCRADLAVVQSLRGVPYPGDIAMQTWLETGDSQTAPMGWSGIPVTPQGWADQPRASWWFSAGEVSLSAGLPESRGSTYYLLHVPDEFAAHDAVAPAEFRGLVRPSGTPFQRLQPLQAALLASSGVAPYPAPAFLAASKADAQLGVYVSTLQELIDNPTGLSRPESRAFALLVLSRLQRVNEEYGVKVSFAPMRAAILGPIPDDPKQIDRLFRRPLASAVSIKWPEDRRNAFLLGVLIAQVAYNAAVLHDAAADADFRYQFSSIPPYQGISTAARADVVALLNLPNLYKGGTWPEVNSAASRATLTIATDP